SQSSSMPLQDSAVVGNTGHWYSQPGMSGRTSAKPTSQVNWQGIDAQVDVACGAKHLLPQTPPLSTLVRSTGPSITLWQSSSMPWQVVSVVEVWMQAYSQPSVGSPLMSKKPGLHANWQTPPEQVPRSFVRRHLMPQLPQLLGSLSRSNVS